jgi:hypothetical protein
VYKFTTSVTELGSVTDGQPAGSGQPELPVPRVYFQKICGFWAGISGSQSFFEKDL